VRGSRRVKTSMHAGKILNDTMFKITAIWNLDEILISTFLVTCGI
jgi:hypothetical protein